MAKPALTKEAARLIGESIAGRVARREISDRRAHQIMRALADSLSNSSARLRDLLDGFDRAFLRRSLGNPAIKWERRAADWIGTGHGWGVFRVQGGRGRPWVLMLESFGGAPTAVGTYPSRREAQSAAADFVARLGPSKGRNPAPRLGSGKRFAALERELARRPGIYSPAGLAAAIGRRKYGRRKMQQMAAAGRRRATRARNPSHRAYRVVLELPGRQRAEVIVRASSDAAARKYVTGPLFARRIPRHAAIISLKRADDLRRNPAPADRALERASDAFAAFTGRSPRHVERYMLRDAQAGWALGEVPEMHYIATRDGERAHFVHKFRRESRPLLVASSDGSQLYLLGGAYRVTDRGIEDRR